MSWIAQVHAKARILLAQIENARKLAELSGIDPAAVCEPLYREVDALYETEFPLAKAMDESDLVFHVEGPALRDHTPKLQLIESLFSTIRQQVFSVAKAVARLSDDRAITDKDVELSLSALAPGSLYIGIKAEPPSPPDGQQHILGDTDPILLATREAMRSIRIISRHLNDETPEAQKELPDPRVRDAALVAIARLAPTGRAGISQITIASASGQGEGGLSGEPLTPKLRKELRRQLRTDRSHGSTLHTLRGYVRELDLDFQRFELRRLEVDASATVRCHLVTEAFVNLEELAGRHVEVVGSGEEGTPGVPRMLRVMKVSVLDKLGGIDQNSGLFDRH